MFCPINLYKPSQEVCFMWINNEIKQKVQMMSVTVTSPVLLNYAVILC